MKSINFLIFGVLVCVAAGLSCDSKDSSDRAALDSRSEQNSAQAEGEEKYIDHDNEPQPATVAQDLSSFRLAVICGSFPGKDAPGEVTVGCGIYNNGRTKGQNDAKIEKMAVHFENGSSHSVEIFPVNDDSSPWSIRFTMSTKDFVSFEKLISTVRNGDEVFDQEAILLRFLAKPIVIKQDGKEIDGLSVVDLGSISRNASQSAQKTFQIENPGTAPVRILDVKIDESNRPENCTEKLFDTSGPCLDFEIDGKGSENNSCELTISFQNNCAGSFRNDVEVSYNFGGNSSTEKVTFQITASNHFVLGSPDPMNNQTTCDYDLATRRDFFCHPSGVWTDGKRMAVADSGNFRVLLWDDVKNSRLPDRVVGQNSFSNKKTRGFNGDGAPHDVEQHTDPDKIVVSATLKEPYEHRLLPFTSSYESFENLALVGSLSTANSTQTKPQRDTFFAHMINQNYEILSKTDPTTWFIGSESAAAVDRRLWWINRQGETTNLFLFQHQHVYAATTYALYLDGIRTLYAQLFRIEFHVEDWVNLVAKDQKVFPTGKTRLRVNSDLQEIEVYKDDLLFVYDTGVDRYSIGDFNGDHRWPVPKQSYNCFGDININEENKIGGLDTHVNPTTGESTIVVSTDSGFVVVATDLDSCN